MKSIKSNTYQFISTKKGYPRLPFLTLVLLFFFSLTFGQKNTSNPLKINHINCFKTNENLDLEQALAKDFVSFDQLSISSDSSYYWISLELQNSENFTQESRLKLFKEWCELAIVYSRTTGDKQWYIQKTGYSVKLDELDVNPDIRSDILKMPNTVSLSFKPFEKKEVIVKYTKVMRPEIKIEPQIYTIAEISSEILKDKRFDFRTAGFMAMLIIISVFHLFFFFVHRDKVYLFYAFYAFCAAFATTVMDYYGLFTYHLFYSQHPQLQPYVFFWIGSLTIIAYSLFTRTYLHTKERFPRIDKLILILIYLGLLMCIVNTINYTLTGKQYIKGMPFSAYIMLLAITFLLTFAMVWRKRTKADLFFLAGVAILVLISMPFHIFSLLGIEHTETFLGEFRLSDAMQIGILAELTIFSMGLGYRTNKIHSDNRYFRELDGLKSKFFANISHEFRTPLTLIKGPLESIKEKLSEPQDRQMLETAQKHSQKILDLVNQVMDLSKLESNNMALKYTHTDFVAFAKGLFYSFESIASQKNIKIVTQIEPNYIALDLDYSKMEIVLNNLLSNAFKFTEDGGQITLKIIGHHKLLKIQIIDTGLGINSKHLPFIFNRFYQADQQPEMQGSGIGLALVKELINLHNGEIEVFSELGKGTRFEIKLPISKNKNTPKYFPEFETKSIEATPENNINNSDAHYNVLLIEDHSEVRSFIKLQLSKSYKVIEAKDGEEGIKKAIQLMPDIVVSDVMMPKKNGYEVTKVLKGNILTSHIPVVLLTAKTARDEKMEGLLSGADDYLAKPFDLSELTIRINNLLKIRQELKVRFSKAIQIKPKEVSSNSIDQEFMIKALAIIEKHIGNEQLNVELFSKEIGIGTTQLNLKLRKLIGQSTNQFIKSTRLQRAADLLIKEVGTVSEIGFQTGFSSTAYFVSSFKKQFGISPGAYKASL